MRKRALTVYYNENTMEVTKVDFGKDFLKAGALSRLDVLKDSYSYITEIYNLTIKEWETELTEASDIQRFKGVK